MFLISAILAAAAGLAATSDLSSRLPDLLERDDRVAVAAAAGPDTELGIAEWVDLRDVVDKFECIDVRAVESSVESLTGDAALFRVEITATALTAGSPRREVLLPGRWMVRFDRTGTEWRMKSAMMLERYVIQQMFAARDAAVRDEILRAYAGDVDPSLLARTAARYYVNTDEQWAVAFRLGAMSGDPAAESFVYRVAASMYSQRHEPERAGRYANMSRRLAEESGNADAVAESFHATGYVHWWNRELDEAVAAFLRSADLTDRLDDPRIGIKSMQMAGFVENARGNLFASVPLVERSVVLSRRYGWMDGDLNGLVTLGDIHGHLGNRAMRDATAHEVIRRAGEIGWQSVGVQSMMNLFDSHTAAGDYAAAEQLLWRVLRHSDATGLAHLTPRLGNLALARGDLSTAENYYQCALASRDQYINLAGAASLGRMRVQQGRFDEAIALARMADEVYAKVPYSPDMIRPWLPAVTEGEALEGLGRNAEAIAAFERAIGIVETQNAAFGATMVTFLSDKSEPYLDLLRLRVAEGAVTESLKISERLKARVLKDVLANGNVDLHAVLTAAERAEEEELNRRVEELNRARGTASGRASPALGSALMRAQVEQQNFLVRMQLAHSQFRRGAPAQVDAAMVQRWLDGSRLVPSADSIVLDYVVAEEETILFALTRGVDGRTAVRVFRLPFRRAALHAAVTRLASRIERRDLGYGEPAEELYRQLIAPASALLAGKRNICIIPHGPLWQVPFAVLRAAGGRHLIERAAVHYAPSLAFLDLTGKSERWLPENPRVLALGNPTISSESRARVRSLTRATLGDLPEAEREARDVGKLYGGLQAQVLVELAATEEAVKSIVSNQDILHFATHGISQTAQPLYSSLVLAAGSEREDGLLEAREIVRMNVPAHLAVLSACETARGGIMEGEGVIGLSWAFLVAGCSRTVATQWRADSAAAMKAMVEFHRRIARTPGGGSVPGALREAQLSLLHTPRYSHPYYWGGFVMIGAGW